MDYTGDYAINLCFPSSDDDSTRLTGTISLRQTSNIDQFKYDASIHMISV
jgi:hypothetical protein